MRSTCRSDPLSGRSYTLPENCLTNLDLAREDHDLRDYSGKASSTFRLQLTPARANKLKLELKTVESNDELSKVSETRFEFNL